MGPAVGQALEFLSQVLSQRGPDAVPYAEGVKYNIREHVSELLKMFPNLSIRVSEFHTNEGRIHNLLKAEGTIPIHYQGHKYNIPVVFWLPERYPVSAPIVYVTPTPTMVVKQGHSYVDPSGLVCTPCLLGWLFPSSDLSATAQEMAMVFGAEPPLYSKPPGYVPPPSSAQGMQGGYGAGAAAAAAAAYRPPSVHVQQQQQHQNQHQNQQQQQQGYPSIGAPGSSTSPTRAANGGVERPGPSPQPMWGAGGGSYPAPGDGSFSAGGLGSFSADAGSVGGYGGAGSYSTPGGYGAAQQKPATDSAVHEAQSAFRGVAIAAVGSRLRAASDAYTRHVGQQVEAALAVQRTLSQRGQELARVVSSIQQERAGTEGLVAELGTKCRQLEGWLEENEWKAAALAGGSGGSHKKGAAKQKGKLDMNKVVVPADDLSRQALAAQAEDLATEDALVVLDRALGQGALPTDAYLRQVRMLCRRQFFARARGLKVASLQQRAGPVPIGGGGSHPSQGACQLVHGDSWSHSPSVHMR